MSIALLLIAAACIALSGAPGLLLDRRSNSGQRIAAALNIIGSIIGAIGLLAHFTGSEGPALFASDWSMPLGRFVVGLDDLSAVFVIPILLISALGSIY